MHNCKGQLKQLCLFLIFIFICQSASAAPKPVLWKIWTINQSDSQEKIDHLKWQSFLSKYVTDSIEPGVNLVKYSSVSDEDKANLTDYIALLTGLDVSNYNPNEQLAYWINLYNAATVDLVLKKYPVSSIRDIRLGGVFSAGPWDTNILTVNGHELSLNDIEHRILRPIWKDARIHYAVNCASYSCPNLSKEAFLGDKIDSQLSQAAHAYVNHERGVTFRGSELVLSKIYYWFNEDFGDSQVRLLQHLIVHAEPELKDKLINHKGKIAYQYHWALNEVP